MSDRVRQENEFWIVNPTEAEVSEWRKEREARSNAQTEPTSMNPITGQFETEEQRQLAMRNASEPIRFKTVTEQEQKCLRGEHQADSRHHLRADEYLIGAAICIHCRCLYVLKP